MAKKKRGRPKLPKGKLQTAVVTVRMSPKERETISDAAKAAGQKLSAWIRETLLAEANSSRVTQNAVAKLSMKSAAQLPSVVNVWRFNEGGGTVKVETPDPLSRVLWERMRKYIDVLEPQQSET